MAVDPGSPQEQMLVVEYHIATEQYAAAVGKLARHGPSITKEDYGKLLQIVEDARNECECLRTALGRLHEAT